MQAFLKGGTAGFSNKSKEKSNTGKPAKEGKKKHIPWVEKYRPRCINDIAYQDEVVAVLNKSLEGADLPNLLFYGPPGTGKTSTILAAARDLFGQEMFKNRVLELNASDERGIDVVREKVKKFSMLTASGTRPDGKSCPPFKIVILDEADSMTNAAQAALRRTMEKESRTTRFCLICNYVTRIIEPITSRCAKFRFKPLSDKILTQRLKMICDKEDVICDEKAIKALIEASEGDLRKAITFLQSSFRLQGDEVVTETVVLEIAGVCPEKILEQIMKSCHSDSYEKLDSSVKHIISEGYSATQVLTQIHGMIIDMGDLDDHQKSAICEKMAVVDKCLMDGADEYLQLMAFLGVVMEQICHK